MIRETKYLNTFGSITEASDLTDQREYERKEEAVMREREIKRESL